MIRKLIKKLFMPMMRETIKEWENETLKIVLATREEVSEPDPVERMRLHLRGYHDAHREHVTKNPYSCEIDMENHSDSYKWLCLPIPDESPETVANMIGTDVELFPNDRLAGILLEKLRTELPTGVNLDSIGIDRIGTLFRFCISGSTSLEALQNVSEPRQSDHDLKGKK